MAKKSTDDVTLKLIEEIKRQKEEISKAEKPRWLTNCSFSYSEKPSDSVNVRVEGVKNLICFSAFLIEKERSYVEASNLLGVEAPPFTWCGFKPKEWLEDFKTLINKAQIDSKKKKLEVLESRLNAIISPELRAQMELEAISRELNAGN